MVSKRLLDCTASDFAQMTGQDLKQAIKASEGRSLIAEVISATPPLYPSVTNAELAAAFGADMILLNFFDVQSPCIKGLPDCRPKEVVHLLKRLTGRPVGLNLEPVDPHARQAEELSVLPPGRLATAETFSLAKQLGFDFVCLTGNPKTGVTNSEIEGAIRTARAVMGAEMLVIAGKMHGAGVEGETGGCLVAEEAIQRFAEAGADIILLPSPGTIPGITLDVAKKLVDLVHAQGAMALLATGTSQEGSDEATIRQIALHSKMAGADLYHIGDAGYSGIAIPENIMHYSITVRGKRHTYVRMASSVIR
ncbi:haloacid dehalogenase-like hydrolase [Brevibacillus ruminantium]|uniref:Haloacid dehalogenase-like hydrolase n=1 Tax=Brevibacillus ruminantium TaxID=2950604 RepID=A0ABY4WJ24_9BACL|nr:haloacid dehalogenase-like hydrolase [Brevibacillus ruminantium]USG65845.1 haloacid dehalogenase-like hydrolase [Brevibacillus ruminantium]